MSNDSAAATLRHRVGDWLWLGNLGDQPSQFGDFVHLSKRVRRYYENIQAGGRLALKLLQFLENDSEVFAHRLLIDNRLLNLRFDLTSQVGQIMLSPATGTPKNVVRRERNTSDLQWYTLL